MIRYATKEDIPAILKLGREMHEESNYADLTYSEDKVKAIVENLLETGVVFVAERHGEIIGGIMGMTYSPYFSDDKIATDLGLFLAKTTRGLMTAPTLIKMFTNWAELQPGVKQIRPGISVGGDIDGVKRLYERCGYKTVGAVFMKEV